MIRSLKSPVMKKRHLLSSLGEGERGATNKEHVGGTVLVVIQNRNASQAPSPDPARWVRHWLAAANRHTHTRSFECQPPCHHTHPAKLLGRSPASTRSTHVSVRVSEHQAEMRRSLWRCGGGGMTLVSWPWHRTRHGDFCGFFFVVACEFVTTCDGILTICVSPHHGLANPLDRCLLSLDYFFVGLSYYGILRIGWSGLFCAWPG